MIISYINIRKNTNNKNQQFISDSFDNYHNLFQQFLISMIRNVIIFELVCAKEVDGALGEREG